MVSRVTLVTLVIHLLYICICTKFGNCVGLGLYGPMAHNIYKQAEISWRCSVISNLLHQLLVAQAAFTSVFGFL